MSSAFQDTPLKATIVLFICSYEATEPHQHCFNYISGAIVAPESHKDLQEEPLKAVLICESASLGELSIRADIKMEDEPFVALSMHANILGASTATKIREEN